MPKPAPSALVDAVESFMQALHMNLQESSLESLTATEWTLSQARSIMILAQASEPLPINELATRLQLLKQGLIDRQEDPRDRRIKRVSHPASPCAGRARPHHQTGQHVRVPRSA